MGTGAGVPVWMWLVFALATLFMMLISNVVGSLITGKINGSKSNGKSGYVSWPDHNKSIQRVHDRVDEIRDLAQDIKTNTAVLKEKVENFIATNST